MSTLLISYDLGLPETYEDYKLLIQYIKSYSSWAKPLQSVWLIKTTKTSAQVRDEIKAKIDSNDKILVVDVTKTGWATFNVSKEVTGWMKENL
ncbi:MAG: hypothetical protein A2445_05655 [Candidatus Jacksonbacteria bacterium RIFOXYC2_FULL_44_29]|nr:MAG: hypothetical protein UW45_C0008G0013 [Parcubacteria group bacterium GW2011_GWC2_44_22]OGY75999.1 MAG: hypothetical protein A2240_05500 [Candidatus Jacksonbacteria bacterium RIFOXYA2_FULL_43_12]OGY76765.1 MAG: hypothetical protein A2295_00300 [Candidatus Jacksonbacteria bacterium RIFOXYB2_FULL_44_15]OGY79172.1 MAG: hypothetical protein A2445_05655 [Candidatus Jacksonbacteria bacterium RIFOXYC2_FULL_44_29]OGY82109.1 MAG: hypothetical protein A2550_00225 [Candidatus Jacksonbacteria bacteri